MSYPAALHLILRLHRWPVWPCRRPGTGVPGRPPEGLLLKFLHRCRHPPQWRQAAALTLARQLLLRFGHGAGQAWHAAWASAAWAPASPWDRRRPDLGMLLIILFLYDIDCTHAALHGIK